MGNERGQQDVNKYICVDLRQSKTDIVEHTEASSEQAIRSSAYTDVQWVARISGDASWWKLK